MVYLYIKKLYVTGRMFLQLCVHVCVYYKFIKKSRIKDPLGFHNQRRPMI